MNSKKIVSVVLCLLMLISIVPISAISTLAYSTNADGYKEIYTIEELYSIRNDLTANYILMNDIDLTEATAKGGDYDFMGNGWNPIGSNDVYGNLKFSGIFDGNGHTIKGMRIDVTSLPSGASNLYIGLFSDVSGTVKNINLTGIVSCTVPGGTYIYAGAICGSLYGGIVKNCHVSATYKRITYNSSCASSYFGGVVGISKISGAEIIGCSAAGNATIGHNRSGSYSGFGDAYFGGILCEGNDTIISQCFNIINVDACPKGSPNGSYAFVGGICFFGNKLTIKDCYNAGNVTFSGNSNGYLYSAGIIESADPSCVINNCYNIGQMSERNRYGIGGNASNSYYLSDSGTTTTGATSLSEAQMKLESMYKGFDFENVWIINNYAKYPYPQLRNNIQDLQVKVDTMMILIPPYKTDYIQGEELDLDGLMVDVIYVNGEEELIDITMDMISGFNTSVVGEQTVTITYLNATETFTVNVSEAAALVGISLVSEPSTTTFAVGTTFDYSGAQLLLTYDDSTTKTIDVTSDMVSGGTNTKIGTYTMTVSYGGFTDTFIVKVVATSISSIEILTLPNKVEYSVGDAFDATGLSINVIFNSGKIIPLSKGYTISGFDSNIVGTKTITVTYNKFTTTFDVDIYAASVNDAGDINSDGCVNAKDALLLTKYFAGYDVIVNQSALDVNGDGKINVKDLTRLVRYLAGENVELYGVNA